MPCCSEFDRPIGQYLKYFLVLVTCLQLARCLQLSCNLLAHTTESQDDHMEVWTWLLWLAGRFSSPKHLPRNAHPHPFLCGDAYGTAFWALHLSCAQHWYLCHYSNSLGWFVLAFFCHMAQGMLSNAGSSELSLHLRAGRASQILNKHLHESLQVKSRKPALLGSVSGLQRLFLSFSPLEEVYIRILLKFKIPHLPFSQKSEAQKGH